MKKVIMTVLTIMAVCTVLTWIGAIKIDRTEYRILGRTYVGNYVTYFNTVRLSNHRIYDGENNLVKMYNEAFILED